MISDGDAGDVVTMGFAVRGVSKQCTINLLTYKRVSV
jgi:hypothetical protein